MPFSFPFLVVEDEQRKSTLQKTEIAIDADLPLQPQRSCRSACPWRKERGKPQSVSQTRQVDLCRVAVFELAALGFVASGERENEKDFSQECLTLHSSCLDLPSNFFQRTAYVG
jgi:hypothetical protein